MERKRQASKTKAESLRGQRALRHSARSAKSVKQSQASDLEKTLALIRAKPGIRPSEINRLLNREESDGLRGTLIKRGLIRKEKDGSAMRYYPV